jgi:hypothetical protein
MHKISQLTARRQNSRQPSTFKLSNYVAQLGLVTDPDDFQVIAFCPEFVPLTGGLAPAMLFGQLLYLTGSGQSDADGWVDQTQRELRQRTTLTRWQQELARQKLRQRRLLEEKWSDDPDHGRCYRINMAVFIEVWRRHHAPPAKTSGSKSPRGLLTPVTTSPPPMDSSQPEAPRQTDMLLTYDTPSAAPDQTRHASASMWETRTLPPNVSPPETTGQNINDSHMMRVSRRMEEPRPSAAGAPISPPTDMPDGTENPNDFHMMRVSHGPPAGNPHHEIGEIINEIGSLLANAGGESIKEKQKTCARAREISPSVVSVVSDAGATNVLALGQEPPAASPPIGSTPPPVGTPAPAQVPLVEEVRGWAQKHTPGLDLVHQHARWLAYCQAMELTFENLPKAFRRWLWEAHARATRNGHTPAAQPAPTPATPSPDAALDAQWRLEYDRLYAAEALQPARAPDHVLRAEDMPAEASQALVEALATGMGFPAEGATADASAVPSRLGVSSEPQGLRVVREALETSRGRRSGELDWRAREVLEEARDAWHKGRLTAEQLHQIKSCLRAAESLAEVHTIAAGIAGAGEPFEPRTIEDGAPP